MRKAPWLALLILASCDGPMEAPKRGKAKAVTVDALPVEKLKVERSHDALGTLEARERVSVSAEMNGIVESIHFNEGDVLKFKADGEEEPPVLFRLDGRLLQLEVRNADAQLKVTEADLARKQATFERKEKMFREKAAPEAAYVDAKLDRDRALAARAQAQAALDIAMERLSKTEIHAPIAGVLGERNVSPGDYVKSGEALVEIVQIDPVDVSFTIPERFQADLKTGLDVTIATEALPGRSFGGKVIYVAPEVDPSTRTFRLKAEIPNADFALKPGVFARVRLIIGAAKESLVVPEEAVVPRGDKFFVYIVADGKAHVREVRLGQRLPGKVVILEGLEGSETVITAGLQRVSDGFDVLIREGK